MAHRPLHSTSSSRASPGWPQDPYQGLWPGGDPDVSASGMQEGTGLLAPLPAIRFGSVLKARWLSRGLG
ncbi:hypothetical protein ASC71_06495 [Rhizobium sp. Root1240]|nr:hypothetical protein ASC71_06495 [Rhizobium sp. Root1240]